MERKNMTTQKVLLGLVLAGVASGLVFFFAAPQSMRARRMIQAKGKEVIGKSSETIQRTSSQVGHTVSSARQRAGLRVLRIGNQIGSQLLGL